MRTRSLRTVCRIEASVIVGLRRSVSPQPGLQEKIKRVARMAFGTIKNVRKVFSAAELKSRSSEPVVALDDANFEFDEGQLVALLARATVGALGLRA